MYEDNLYCEEYYDEEDLYFEYGEGFENDLKKYDKKTKNKYNEPLDTTLLNSKKISKTQMDDYFLVIE